MVDMDKDGDLDYVGIFDDSGATFIVEQVEPDTSLVVNLSLPDDFDEPITKLVILLTKKVPLKGIPKAVLANIDNTDMDGNGELDIDQMLGSNHKIMLSFEDVENAGDFHVMAVVYVEGGGNFQPKSGADYEGHSDLLTFGGGKIEVNLDLSVMDQGIQKNEIQSRDRFDHSLMMIGLGHHIGICTIQNLDACILT